MTIDFETPMTFYELICIISSAIAIMIPIVKWAVEKWFKRLKIDFLISDVVTVYFNNSGSYINLGGVYRTKNKTVTIKNISAQVIRKSDNATLDLNWSVFSSPTVKEIGGQYERSFETAHPFNANADMLTPAFVEFTSEKNISENISADLLKLYNYEREILQQGLNFFDATGKAHVTSDYSDSKVKLHEYCFWKLGYYEIRLITKYNNDAEFIKEYSFELSDEDVIKLQNNIENLLIEPIASSFNFRLPYLSVMKKVTELQGE